MSRHAPGPGDPETWGAPTGHPNDPRTEEALCPTCEEPLDEGGCPDCGWGIEPDYEAMVADRDYGPEVDW